MYSDPLANDRGSFENRWRRRLHQVSGLAVLLLAVVWPTSPAAAQGPGWIHKWSFNGHTRDSIGTTHATLHGGAATIRGALALDGNDDYALVASDPSIGFTKAYTVLAWLESTGASNTYRVILSRGAGSANDVEIYIQSGTNHLIVYHNRTNGGTGGYVGFTPPPANKRFYLAVTFDGSNVRAYYDGVEQAFVQRNRAVIPPLDTKKPLQIGRTQHPAFRSGKGYFKGEIEEIRIHDRALPALWVNIIRRLGPTPAGTFVAFGRACGGTRAPSLSVPANVCPSIGKSFPIHLRSSAANAPALLLTGWSTTRWQAWNLPLDLGWLTPGCRLYTSLDIVTSVRTDGAGSATQTVPVPNQPALAGFELHNQWMVAAPVNNKLVLLFSNAGTIQIGWP